ncbi:uncharacterized protein LOC132566216 [Heteronotia binoei]|uniref:uncharacterized protein LOC132566216 n=1 Tax=Heteronotia binoei TaxID=13085 RepID=UPI002930DC7B|nr:uncharacterized protein LOC132566216 [Heteronotia binoei]
MSNKNSAGCDSESECDYYSECWEESSYKDVDDSNDESDLYLCCHQTFSCSSFERENGKRKLSEIVLISEKNQTNFTNCCKNCPLLQARKLENTKDFQVELSSECILQFTFEGHQTSDYPSRAYSCDRSCQDILCLSSGIPHITITEKSVKQPTFYTVKELYQKQTLADCLVTSSHKKSVQVSCTEREVLENIECKCFKRSLVPDEINKTPVKEPWYHGSICNKNRTSSQLITESLDYSSETLDKTNSPQTPECICSCASSGGLIISLTLEAAYPTDPLAGSITTTEAKLGTKDSRRHALAFKFKGPEQNQLFQKLYISVIPNSVHLNTESLKQTTHCTKQTGLPQIQVHEASQPLSTQTDSSESSSSDFYPYQVPFTLKPQASNLSFLSSKQTHVKVLRPMKSIVFPKNKEVREDQRIKNQSSKFHWCTTWDIESINHSIHNYKPIEELEINELYYVPQTQISTCQCSPLLDLSVNLNSERRYSATEKQLGINRKLYKRTRGAKVMPRFSSQYLLNPRSSFERLYYISPTRKKNHLKMKTILGHCLGCSGGQNRNESCKEKICPIVDSSDTRGHGLFTPHLSTDVHSTAPLFASSWNSPALLPHAGPVPNERRHSPIPCMQRPTGSPAALCSLQNKRWQSPPCLQTERDTYPVALYSLPNERKYSPAPCLQTKKENWHYPDGKCHDSCSPCANNVNVVQPWKERNVFNMEEVDSDAAQVVCGDLALKKLLVCPCGNMPQYGLFPNGDISQPVSTKAKKSPDTTQKTSLIKSDATDYPRGTFNTMETCCSKCHHLFPSHSMHSICRQETLRSQFAKAQSYFEYGFPMKNLKKDIVQKTKEAKTVERKNVRIHARPGTSQQTGPLSPSRDGYSGLNYAVYEPKCCSHCPTVVKQLHGTSREAPTSFSSKHKLLENCLNKQAFLLEPCKETRTRCTCSQEIPLFCVDQTNIYERNRAVLPKRMDSGNTQDSLQIHHSWKRNDKSHQCCRDKVQYSHLQ